MTQPPAPGRPLVPAWQAGRRKWRGPAPRPPPRRPACSRCWRRGPSRAGSRCIRPGPSGWTGEARPRARAPGPLSGLLGPSPPARGLGSRGGAGRAAGSGQAPLQNFRPRLPFLSPGKDGRGPGGGRWAARSPLRLGSSGRDLGRTAPGEGRPRVRAAGAALTSPRSE